MQWSSHSQLPAIKMTESLDLFSICGRMKWGDDRTGTPLAFFLAPLAACGVMVKGAI